MRQPPTPPTQPEPRDQLAMLTALGFGPDTVLMNDPKLFVDGRFLASLLVELRDELGDKDARLALFQIGLLHGLRDAARICGAHESGSDHDPDAAETTALVLNWQSVPPSDCAHSASFEGQWPERHEGFAHRSRLGESESPACWMSAGYTSGWLSGTLDRDLYARETQCTTCNDEACRFEVREASDWIAMEDEEMAFIVREVPFEAFRAVASSPSFEPLGPIESELCAPSEFDSRVPAETVAGDGQFDRTQPVVHIWGPVMVLPFTTLDEALGTVDMLGRDPGISEIKVVVVDLREQFIDDGFGAAALEQVLETVERWDAQTLITGVSLASEPALEGLESSHLVLRKDLPDAIATAFQIADAQKYQV